MSKENRFFDEPFSQKVRKMLRDREKCDILIPVYPRITRRRFYARRNDAEGDLGRNGYRREGNGEKENEKLLQSHRLGHHHDDADLAFAFVFDHDRCVCCRLFRAESRLCRSL